MATWAATSEMGPAGLARAAHISHAPGLPLARLAAALQRPVDGVGLLWHAVALTGLREVVLGALGEVGWLEAPPGPIALAAVLLDLPGSHVGNIDPRVCDGAMGGRGRLCVRVSHPGEGKTVLRGQKLRGSGTTSRRNIMGVIIFGFCGRNQAKDHGLQITMMPGLQTQKALES